MAFPARSATAVLVPVGFLMLYQGYVLATNAAVAPSIAVAFGLGDSAVAGLFAFASLGAFATLALSRAIDRFGRRPLLLAVTLLLPVAALASAAAPSLAAYASAQVLVHGLSGALLNVLVVIVAEELPVHLRSRGHAVAGLCASVGNGIPLVLVAVLGTRPDAWRWVWLGAGAPLVAWPLIARLLPETACWRHARPHADAARRPALAAHRRVMLLAVAVSFALGLQMIATQTWTFYHPVQSRGLAPATATVLVLCGGALGLAGFSLGGRLAERRGRRPTLALATSIAALLYAGFYGLPAIGGGALPLLLGALFAGGTLGGNMALTAQRALVTELVPTALRGTLQGWLAMIAAATGLVANAAISLLAGPLGGLGPAVAVLAVLGAAGVLACLPMLPETTGVVLDDAVGEPEPAAAPALRP